MALGAVVALGAMVRAESGVGGEAVVRAAAGVGAEAGVAAETDEDVVAGADLFIGDAVGETNLVGLFLVRLLRRNIEKELRMRSLTNMRKMLNIEQGVPYVELQLL